MTNLKHPASESALRTPHSALAIVALGSNLGDSREIILDAMARLQIFSGETILKSSLWQTSPVDCPPDSPKFVNAIVGLAPREGETPESLHAKLQALEKEFGRVPKKVLNEPRPLDLDLIAFGNEIRNSPELTVPHPRAHLRRFVLQPLSEIAPDLILPGQGRTVAELLAALPEDCLASGILPDVEGGIPATRKEWWLYLRLTNFRTRMELHEVSSPGWKPGSTADKDVCRYANLIVSAQSRRCS